MPGGAQSVWRAVAGSAIGWRTAASGGTTRRHTRRRVPAPGVNNLSTYGRWAFAELTEVYKFETDLAAKVERALGEVIDGAAGTAAIDEPWLVAGTS